MKTLVKVIWAAISAAAGMTASPAHAQPSFHYKYVVTGVTATELGTLGGQSSVAYDINAAGNVTGWADNVMGNRRAFLFGSGVMIDLDPGHPATTSEARGINNHNHVVGVFTSPNGTHAFRWIAGAFVQLNDFIPSNAAPIRSQATAITDLGLIVGEIRAEFPETAAVMWFNPVNFRILAEGNAAFEHFASDINIHGEAVGFDTFAESPRRWRLAGLQVISQEIPRPGPDYDELGTRPRGINSSGRVVGYAYTSILGSPARRAWYWDGISSNSVDLGVLPNGTFSAAEDINDAGFIVGSADRIVRMPWPFNWTNLEAAFLHHPHFGLYELPVPPGTRRHATCRANALNELTAAGLIQVVGDCDFPGGPRAVRWDVTVVLQYAGPVITWP